MNLCTAMYNTDRLLDSFEKIANSLEKIANKEDKKDDLPPGTIALLPGVSLSQWRVASLKRIEKAVEMIDEVMNYPENLPEDNNYENLTYIATEETLTLPREFFEDLKNALMGR
jgi:hypothetical protein